MIPAVTGWLPRRRAVPPPEAAGCAVYGITSHGSTDQQAAGPLPEWPADWADGGRYRLDRCVFGDVPRVGP